MDGASLIAAAAILGIAILAAASGIGRAIRETKGCFHWAMFAPSLSLRINTDGGGDDWKDGPEEPDEPEPMAPRRTPEFSRN